MTTAVASSAQDKPRLIVQITMDQLRGDLLRDYAPALKHGFHRIEAEGYWVRRGTVDHAITLSFPGHTTLATGMHPSHHGLTANEWWLERGGTWKEVDVSDDDAVRTIGDLKSRPGASPRGLLATTLGEWVKQADANAKSVALGTGRTIPVAYAGHRCDGAYWFDSSLNQFTSSTFYMSELPEWVKTFNRDSLAHFEQTTWTLSVPSEYAGLADPTPRSFDHPDGPRTFPHVYEKEAKDKDGNPGPLPRWFAGTPFKDAALFALATQAVDAEKLGQRHATDYLAIDVDSPDSVGHEYGPHSIEQLDTLFRLDQLLGDFLDHLDQVVGKGHYVLALSADHGVADPPETHTDGHRVTMAELEALLDRIEALDLSPSRSQDEIARAIVGALKKASFIADAYTEEDLAHPGKDLYRQLYARCLRKGFPTDFPLWSDKKRDHHPGRYGIVVRFRPNTIIDAATGVHGSPYSYDRDVPIIFFGAGIRHATHESGARTVDVAPTLAAAAKVPVPKGLDGHVLVRALKK